MEWPSVGGEEQSHRERARGRALRGVRVLRDAVGVVPQGGGPGRDGGEAGGGGGGGGGRERFRILTTHSTR
eukprot:29100-Pelagococcus_subviridis.AAC.2